ncbi:MAG: hypothetical protein UV61_C0001G0060 [Candidatus Gottesmanbacteria bacterium GW2011_GWB1_43_11]|uniref:Uncharacterized protein n=1 Tax=Candidatus Gottesmanbacteria bacterium GW2011_GWB1_43_11 TaxID=1618446 RepID=A0A0G1FL79_9BACT|nr:MAG: hypothetical protein UV04_C0004G0002 [Candidatus Gottesmanbacteria bacterium GW2011_GWA2_42_16]KKS81577.1 MAG: hypothetical protein UV55_C0012G0061 [Candidatus Gottesmanbacteria bacterium GW2011_GWC1_43_10]KKS87653.1 MAG: hypothetical protein UV61_C0001G0060 [Candidatus Gottesmanbacteria bacterium GW2011_GWB1_43_11]HCM37174.1 hypothetical protein [Patescibacteria group bacterium]
MTTPLNETLGVFARVFLTPDEFYLDGDTRVFNQRGMLYMETPTGFGGRKRTDQMGKTFIVGRDIKGPDGIVTRHEISFHTGPPKSSI